MCENGIQNAPKKKSNCEANGNVTTIIDKWPESSEKGRKADTVTCLADIIGESGPWQWSICTIKMTFTLLAAFNSLGKTFYAPKQKYWCVDEDTGAALSINGTLQLCGCTRWAFDPEYGSTIISEWNLVCDYGWLPSATQSIFMGGVLLSSLVMSQVSDNFGRIWTIKWGIIVEVLGGIVCILATNIWQFSVGRFLVALGGYTKGLCCHTLVIESLGTSKRAFWTQFNNNGFVGGYLALPIVASLLRDFRQLQAFTTGGVIVTSVLLIWFPESPRWLIAKGRSQEAEGIIRRALRMNSRSDEFLSERIVQLEEVIRKESQSMPSMDNAADQTVASSSQPSPYLQLLRAKNLRIILAIMCYTWFVHGFVYYGVSLNLDQFKFGNSGHYLSFFLSGLVEIPSYVFNIFALVHIGRIHLLSTFLMGVGLTLGGSIFFQDDAKDMAARMTLALTGKFFISAGFNLIYLMALEVFPTVLRQTATGMCSAGARVGAILAPFVKELSESLGLGVALLVFALLALVDAVAVFFGLPEMRGRDIPDTVAGADRLKTRARRKSSAIATTQT